MNSAFRRIPSVLHLARGPVCILLPALLTSSSLPSPAQAELGDVVRSFPCAGPNTGDLAWVDGVLYQVNFAPSDQKIIYRIDPGDGSVLGTIPCAGGSPQGITYDGHNLWQCDITGDMIYKLDPLTGTVRGQWGAPGGSDGQPIGLGWDGASLWLADSRDPEKVWQVDTLGTVIGQIPAPGDSPYGLAWAGGYVWVSDNNLSGGARIYKLDPADGTVLDFFTCPNNGGAPNGITHDGESLWVADNTTDTIYQIDDGMESGWIRPVALASPRSLRLDGAAVRGRTVEVRFTLAREGGVEIGLYDVLGREEALATRRQASPGSHRIRLDPSVLPSGVHFVRVKFLEERATDRLIVVR